MTRHLDLALDKLAGEEGFEPSLTGPEPAVLPLDDSPKTDVTELKSRPLPGLLSDILPSIVALATPQKAAEIGQQIQSLLSNPPNTPIISPRSADINAPSPRLTFFRLNGDFGHITKHLTDLGFYPHIISGQGAVLQCRHGVPPQSRAEGKVILVRTERAMLPLGGINHAN